MLDAPLAPDARRRCRRRTGPDAQTRLKIIDGDVHPALRSVADLKPYLPARWWEHLETYGSRRRLGMSYEPYPKSAPRACRRDAWPEDGGAARLQPRPDPLAVPRRLRHRVRHPGAARRDPARARSTSSSRPRSPRPSTTGSASSSPGPSRACGRPSWCPTRTPKPRWPRSSAAPTIRPSPRCSC